MNSHLGRGFSVASTVSNFLPEGKLCARSRQVLQCQAKHFPASNLKRAKSLPHSTVELELWPVSEPPGELGQNAKAQIPPYFQ